MELQGPAHTEGEWIHEGLSTNRWDHSLVTTSDAAYCNNQV
jgi:hypothetical protein